MPSYNSKDYSFECVFCDPKLEMHFTTTREAMIRHCLLAHGVEGQEQIAKKYYCESGTNFSDLSNVILAQIFEKLPWEDRLKIEQVCKNWQHVGKNLSWSNYRILHNFEHKNWSVEIKPLFERCGSHLRNLTLGFQSWSPQAVSCIRMAPNVQHLRFWLVKLNDESLIELAGIVPGLKSLAIKVSLQYERSTDYTLGLMECFKVMTGLEYLNLDESGALFDQYSFVQFPSNLKYLDLHDVSNAAKILSWVAEGCKNLKGLHLRGITDESLFHAVSQIKSLTYLAITLTYESVTYEIGAHRIEELTELRALEIDGWDEMVISAIAQHCKKLEHLYIFNYSGDVSAEAHAHMIRLASLPNLCSLEIWASNYQKEQITEFANIFVAKGNLQYIKMHVDAQLEPEVLLEILRRCKRIRSVAVDFGPINFDFYSKICQVVDEIDEEDRQQRELNGARHPIVEVQYYDNLAENVKVRYKWLLFKSEVSPSAVRKKWKFGWLGAGKPAWEL